MSEPDVVGEAEQIVRMADAGRQLALELQKGVARFRFTAAMVIGAIQGVGQDPADPEAVIAKVLRQMADDVEAGKFRAPPQA